MEQDAAVWALVEHGARVLELESGNAGLLHRALELGRFGVVGRLLEAMTEEEANMKDSFGASLYWSAYLAGDLHAMGWLAELGANVDEDRGTGYTPLMDACKYGKFGMAREMMGWGADPNVVYTGVLDTSCSRGSDDGNETGDESGAEGEAEETEGAEEAGEAGDDAGNEEDNDDGRGEEEEDEEEEETDYEGEDYDENRSQNTDPDGDEEAGYNTGYTPLGVCACLFNPKRFFRRKESRMDYLNRLSTSPSPTEHFSVEAQEELGQQLVTLLLDKDAEFEGTLDWAARAHEIQFLDAMFSHSS
ncbi:hypothetical protein VTI74DRAFT_246 [Chaetomium olivicolor]